MNITIEQVKTLAKVKEEFGVDITKYENVEGFTSAILKELSSETLDEVVNRLNGDISDQFKELSVQELERRKKATIRH